jgi:hypothetical protein
VSDQTPKPLPKSDLLSLGTKVKVPQGHGVIEGRTFTKPMLYTIRLDSGEQARDTSSALIYFKASDLEVLAPNVDPA